LPEFLFVHEEFNKSGLLNRIDNYPGIRNMTGVLLGGKMAF